MADQDPKRNGGKWSKGMSGNPKGSARTDAVTPAPPAPAPPAQLTPTERNYADIAAFANTGPNHARWDGWMSTVSGIGTTGRDKRLSHEYRVDTISYAEAIDLWRGDDLAFRAIEAVPSECFRAGYEVTIDQDGTGLQEWLESELERLNVDHAIERVFKFERAFGGGGIMLGVNDGQTVDMPLDMARVIDFKWMTPHEPIAIQPAYYYNDPTSAKYGEPSHYMITPSMVGASLAPQAAIAYQYVHESRVIAFPGIRVSNWQPSNMTSTWGDSVLTRVRHVLRDFNIACASAGILAADFSQSIFQMEGLAQFAVRNDLTAMQNRMAAIEMARSTARCVLIDTKEKFERQTTNITGLPELLAWLSTRLAAAIDMPLTLLMGQSPKGLGNEGDSDIRFYYDRIAAVQQRRIRPALRRIIALLMRTRDANKRTEPKKWEINFHPLWQLSDKERAEARYVQAQTDDIYVGNGMLSTEEGRKSRFGGEYSFETTIEADEPGMFAVPSDPATLAAMGHPDPIAPVAPIVPVEPAATVAAPAGEPPAAVVAEVAKTAMNGAQVSSMLEVVRMVTTKEIPRAAGIGVLAIGFQLSEAEANMVLGPDTFVAPAPPTPTAPPPGTPPATPAPTTPTEGTPL